MIRPDRLITILLYTLFREWLYIKKNSTIPILMYHSVSNSAEKKLHSYYKVSTSPKRFEQQMQWLFDNDFLTVKIDKVYNEIESRYPKKNIVLTFDDGFRDFYTNAWPIMKKCNQIATVFLPTSFINNERKLFKNKYCLNWREIKELRSNGISFGSHTVTHPKLIDMDNWELIRLELEESKQEIENELGESITQFCYPYAYPLFEHKFCNKFLALLKNLNYQFNFTTIVGYDISNPYVLQRIPVNDDDDIELFAAKVNGAYKWVGRLQTTYKFIKSII